MNRTKMELHPFTGGLVVGILGTVLTSPWWYADYETMKNRVWSRLKGYYTGNRVMQVYGTDFVGWTYQDVLGYLKASKGDVESIDDQHFVRTSDYVPSRLNVRLHTEHGPSGWKTKDEALQWVTTHPQEAKVTEAY